MVVWLSLDNQELIFDFTETLFDLEDPVDIQPKAVSISWTGVTDTSLTCKVIGFSVVNYNRYVDWFLDNSYYGTTWIYANSSSNNEQTFNWLSPGTTYKISANIHKQSNDEYLWGGSRNLTTTGSSADITKPIITYMEAKQSGNGIRVGVTASDDKSGVESIIYRVSPPSVSKPPESSFNYMKTMPASNNAYTYEVDGNGNPFVNGATYWFQATAKDYAGNYSEPKEYRSCKFTSTRPSPWYWTQDEINAFNRVAGYSVKTLTWQRWNAFINKIAEVDRWRNGLDAGKYYLDQAMMSSSDKTLTAYKFNTARHAIGSMNMNGSGIDPNDIVSGKPVKGSYFITLSDRLNGISLYTSLGTMEQLYNMELLQEQALLEDLNRSRRRD